MLIEQREKIKSKLSYFDPRSDRASVKKAMRFVLLTPDKLQPPLGSLASKVIKFRQELSIYGKQLMRDKYGGAWELDFSWDDPISIAARRVAELVLADQIGIPFPTESICDIFRKDAKIKKWKERVILVLKPIKLGITNFERNFIRYIGIMLGITDQWDFPPEHTLMIARGILTGHWHRMFKQFSFPPAPEYDLSALSYPSPFKASSEPSRYEFVKTVLTVYPLVGEDIQAYFNFIVSRLPDKIKSWTATVSWPDISFLWNFDTPGAAFFDMLRVEYPDILNNNGRIDGVDLATSNAEDMASLYIMLMKIDLFLNAWVDSRPFLFGYLPLCRPVNLIEFDDQKNIEKLIIDGLPRIDLNRAQRLRNSLSLTGPNHILVFKGSKFTVTPSRDEFEDFVLCQQKFIEMFDDLYVQTESWTPMENINVHALEFIYAYYTACYIAGNSPSLLWKT